LEAQEVMKVLRGDPDAPRDLRENSLSLASHVLEFDPAHKGRGLAMAREILDSGVALATMERIIEAQGSSPATYKLGDLIAEIVAPRAGVVTAIDCFRLAQIARLAGAPMDKGAGIELLKKIGDFAAEGEPLYRIRACFATDFRFASELAGDNDGYTISS
jgi:thymidine phosphorylase